MCSQRANGFETLLKSARHHYFAFFLRTRDKLIWKKSALVTSEIFRLFVNTLTPDDKYSHRIMQIFWQQLQTTLSQKGKSFFRVFIVFLKCSWNLQRSEKEEEFPSLFIAEFIAFERDVYLTGSKHCWSQHGTTIFLFFHEFEINWVGKSLS